MTLSKRESLEGLLDRYLVLCLTVSLVILILSGVGNVLIVSILGLLLCAAGFVQPGLRVDMAALALLTGYNLVSMASSVAAGGSTLTGYASTQILYPVLYLLMACLEERDLLLLRRMCGGCAAGLAGLGIAQFTARALTRGARRLKGVMGTANAMGMLLVLGWFALTARYQGEEPPRALRRMEPVVLAALAMTLSMGSFLAMAVGILVLVLEYRGTLGARALYACRLLSKAVLGMGTGMLLYLAADRTGRPWLCLPLLAYLLALAIFWERFGQFLEEYPAMSVGLSCMGFLVAGVAVAVRPSALATFTERLEMMANGLGYLFQKPLLGVGPYRWRMLNLADGDKYFNTWHIHNALLHVGVELGLIAMALLALTAVRYWKKRGEPAGRAGFAAFFCHNMIDTSFFYMGNTAMLLMTAAAPRQRGRAVGPLGVKLMFGAFGLLFACHLGLCLLTG